MVEGAECYMEGVHPSSDELKNHRARGRPKAARPGAGSEALSVDADLRLVVPLNEGRNAEASAPFHAVCVFSRIEFSRPSGASEDTRHQ